MEFQMTPMNLIIVLHRLELDFPKLIGDDTWQEIRPLYKHLLAQLQTAKDEDEQDDLLFEIMALFTPHELARKRIYEEIALNSMVQEAIASRYSFLPHHPDEFDGDLATFYALRWQADGNTRSVAQLIATSSEDLNRQVVVDRRNLDQSKSVKLQNLQINLGELLTLATGPIFLTYEAIDKKSPIFIAGVVLSVIGLLYKEMSEPLSEAEASVFWGFIEAHDPVSKLASEADIKTQTNKMRSNYGLAPLSESKIKGTLRKLKDLRCVSHVDTEKKLWRIEESYKFR